MKRKKFENIETVYTSNLKNKKGITLVALVVTIIILLILAGISIASLTGNGLFQKAKLAKEEHEISVAEEVLKTELMNILANQQGQKDLNNLNGMNVNGYNTQVSNIGKIVTMTKNNESYYFLVDSDYNVRSLNIMSGIMEENNSSSGGQTNTEGTYDSQIINDFEIEISMRTSKELTVNAKSEITTKNESTIKGYKIFLQGKVVDITTTLPYNITNLDYNTSYSGIYIQAIDEDGNIKKSKNILDNEYTSSEPIELIPNDYVCSSLWGGYPASKAFDGSETGSSYWHAVNNSKPQYCGAKFNEKVYVEKFYLSCYYQSKDIVLQASNDGTNWVDIQSYTCSRSKYTYEVTNQYTEKYNYYCIKTITGASYVSYYEIKFYGY